MDRWCSQWMQPRGEVITLEQLWKLARAWYHDHMEIDWRRKTPAEIDELWAELGFTSPFWQLPH